MIDNKPFFCIRHGGGKQIPVLGQEEEFLRSDEDVSVFVNSFEPGTGVPMHIHHQMDEACYVLKGTLKFVTDEETVIANAGDFVSCKRGIPHGFVGIGNERIELLWICNPGGYDAFFVELNQMPIGPEGPDMEALNALAERHNTQLVGPPPTAD